MPKTHRTTWRPDTCRCLLTYEFVEGSQGDPTLVDAEFCEHHQHLGLEDGLQAVLSENRAKNHLLAAADSQGVEVEYAYEPLAKPAPGQARLLKVLAPVEAALAIQVAVEARPGSGPVEVVASRKGVGGKLEPVLEAVPDEGAQPAGELTP